MDGDHRLGTIFGMEVFVEAVLTDIPIPPMIMICSRKFLNYLLMTVFLLPKLKIGIGE
jgi:hypothetical protein